MQKQVGCWQNVKFWNSHLPTRAPECIYEGTVPEQLHIVMIFISMFDGIKKNIYTFDSLESFSNGTPWLDCLVTCKAFLTLRYFYSFLLLCRLLFFFVSVPPL